MDFETFLLNEGYDTTSLGGIMFCHLFEETLYLYDLGKNGEEIKINLKRIYPRYIYNYFKVEGLDFFREMTYFLSSKKGRKHKNYGSIEENLVKLAKKYKEQSKLMSELNLVKVKNKYK